MATREADPFNDEFQCEICKKVSDIECSVTSTVEGFDSLICEDCDEAIKCHECKKSTPYAERKWLDGVGVIMCRGCYDSMVTSPLYMKEKK